MSRTDNCPQCGARPSYYEYVDTFGCASCDIWTSKPHSCYEEEGDCDAGFNKTPEKPSLYKGPIAEATDRWNKTVRRQ